MGVTFRVPGAGDLFEGAVNFRQGSVGRNLKDFIIDGRIFPVTGCRLRGVVGGHLPVQ